MEPMNRIWGIPLPYMCAVMMSLSFFAAMETLDVVMSLRADYWIHAGIPIPFHERLLFALAGFWRQVGVLVMGFVLFGSLSIASVIVAIRRKIWIPPPRKD